MSNTPPIPAESDPVPSQSPSDPHLIPEDPAPTLEVHPPHHTVSTWRDFFIHIATIAVGLLIAVALEQSVEAIHHLHQRYQLEADLHAEAVRNNAILSRDIRLNAIKRAQVVALRDEIGMARAVGPRVDLPDLPPRNNEPSLLPSQAAWTAARDSSQLALLPRDLAQMYEELYTQRDYVITMRNNWFSAYADWDSFDNQFPLRTTSGFLDLTQLTPDQLSQYYIVLTRWITQTDTLTSVLQFYAKENKIVLDGATSGENLQRRMTSAL